MTALDRRTFLRGIAYGFLGAVLGWEIEAIAATEAAPEEEEPEIEFFGEPIIMIGRKPDGTWDACTFRQRSDTGEAECYWEGDKE